MSGDADQLCLEPAAKDSRLGVTARAGESPAAQRRVNMYVAVGHDFGTGADRNELIRWYPLGKTGCGGHDFALTRSVSNRRERVADF